MLNFLKRLYYRFRIKRRLREVKTGVKRPSQFTDPIEPAELMDDEQLKFSY